MAASSVVARSGGVLRLIDVAVNLTDEMFDGVYNGKRAHASDLGAVLRRAEASGVERVVAISGSASDSETHLRLAQEREHHNGIYSTVGVHPTRCNEFEDNGNNAEMHLDRLRRCIAQGRGGAVVAVGEIGLDYDREKFCERDVQKKYFALQLQLAKEAGLPVIFHNRNTGGDFEKMVAEHSSCVAAGGIVHSFTGTTQEMLTLTHMGLCIGVNGCSFKTDELCEMIKAIPQDRIVLETDAPWCEIRPTHAGFKHIKTTWPSAKKEKHNPDVTVKNRYEPCHVIQVLEAAAGVRGEEVEQLAAATFANTMRVLWPHETQQ